MENRYLNISDGFFTISETDRKNQFYFFRNDLQELGEVGEEPIKLFRYFIMGKYFIIDVNEKVMKNIYSEVSKDGKVIRLTVCKNSHFFKLIAKIDKFTSKTMEDLQKEEEKERQGLKETFRKLQRKLTGGKKHAGD